MNIPYAIKTLERSAQELASKVDRGLQAHENARVRAKLADSKCPSVAELGVMMQLALYRQHLADSLRNRK